MNNYVSNHAYTHIYSCVSDVMSYNNMYMPVEPVVSALLPVGHVEIECIAHLPSHACAAANSEAVCCCICMCLYTCKMIYTFNYALVRQVFKFFS